MKYNVLLAGVGGEGILTAQAIIARAAHLEGYYVRGFQLHGLAQRGGSVISTVRFGFKKEIFSPEIMQADADLVIAFEPLEAVKAVYYARREKTSFVIDSEPTPPVYSYILKIPYPTEKEIKKRIQPFAKSLYLIEAGLIAKKEFGSPILSNLILIGAAKGMGLLPIKENNLKKAIEISAPRDIDNNLKAYKIGIEYFKRNV